MSDLHAQLIIKATRSAPEKALIQLYKDAGWWQSSYEKDAGFLNCIVQDSAVFVGAFYDNELIGMGRALSDLASDAYIQDVVVLKKFRGRGVGKKIIQMLVKELKENGVDWIGLVAQPGTDAFYKDLGFETLEDHVPLKYRN